MEVLLLPMTIGYVLENNPIERKIMDIEKIVSVINTLGFPTAMVGYFAWYNVKREDQHTIELSKLSEAIKNNTLVMQKLIDKLDI